MIDLPIFRNGCFLDQIWTPSRRAPDLVYRGEPRYGIYRVDGDWRVYDGPVSGKRIVCRTAAAHQRKNMNLCTVAAYRMGDYSVQTGIKH